MSQVLHIPIWKMFKSIVTPILKFGARNTEGEVVALEPMLWTSRGHTICAWEIYHCVLGVG